MTLKDTIKDDMKTAFKAGDSAKRGTLSMLLSVIQNREIEKRTKSGESELSDEEIVSAISTEIKKRREAATQYEAGGRAESAASEQAEIAVLSVYLPEQLSEDAVKTLIAEAIASTGAAGPKDMGKVMGAVSPKIKGKFDGARASAMVKESLGA
jgi:uncharacterized protein YqeY